MKISVGIVTAMATAALLVPAAPAAAATPDHWGFAFVKDPTTTVATPLDPAYQYGSWKAFAPAALADGVKIGPGRFLVRFPMIGLGAFRGIPHVTAVSNDGHFCEAVRWGAQGADEVVDVQCFKPFGFPDDSQFTVLWTVSSGVTGPGAHAYVHVAALSGIIQQYNSSGAGNSVTTGGPGSYTVRFANVGLAGIHTGNLQVTAVQSNAQPRRCKVARWSWSTPDVYALIACFDATSGAPAYSEFTASFHRERSVHGAVSPPTRFGYVTSTTSSQSNYNSALGFGANSIGGMTVKYPMLYQKETHAQVTAIGDTANYCGLEKPWSDAGGTAVVSVACFDQTGARVGSAYLSTFSSSI
ncbi:hypothetical protein GCM10010399_41320 [Dactylosporangium fulvum]|uniref:Secreted protein n=1 Tax=Dactylosporangium fulvum TaxID=53359 RepID=A0ABY5VX11_9ACTN|nr:hypothetical protein [Dactylosporangium fulvum]UWP82328.1 hypothetical protein Dfulv_45980 [Dactylosporangium fulvum]